jgi:hypothetical protein
MSAGAAAASSAAGAAAASGAGRDDPRLKKRRLVGRSKAEKPADRSKENNAQRFAHNMGEKRCTGHADGERCSCRTSLVGSVASFLQSPAFTDDEGGRAEAAGMFDEMTFSQ